MTTKNPIKKYIFTNIDTKERYEILGESEEGAKESLIWKLHGDTWSRKNWEEIFNKNFQIVGEEKSQENRSDIKIVEYYIERIKKLSVKYDNEKFDYCLHILLMLKHDILEEHGLNEKE